MRERKERAGEERDDRGRDDRERMRPPNMARALPPASVYGGYLHRGPLGTTAPWPQPGQYMFYNDDVDEASSPAQYPNYHTSSMFQRR